MATTTTTKVFVHDCNRCGQAYFGFSAKKPIKACNRCGNTFLPVRIITNPAPEVLAQAEQDTQALS